MGHIPIDAATIDEDAIAGDDADTLGVRIVETVADATGADPLDLEPLYNVIDQEALAGLFQAGATGEVTFSYHGCAVTVTADGQVSVDEGMA